MNTVNTIDSLENKIDSLSKNNRSVDTFKLYDTLFWTQLNNSIDTLYDTIYTTQYDTVYVNMYTNKTVNENKIFEDYSFYIVFGIMMILAIWWKIKK